MKLPAPEADFKDIVAYGDALEDECYRDPNRVAWEMSKQRWMDLYTGNHYANPLVSQSVAAGHLEPEERNTRETARSALRLVYNRVINAVLAGLAAQISSPFRTVFAARESGEPPVYYLNGYVQNPALMQIAMAAGAQSQEVQSLTGANGPYQPDHPQVQQAAIEAGQSIPLPSDLADQVKLLIDNGQMQKTQAMQAGMPPPQGIVPPEALVEITDQTTAQFTQTIYDALWEQCGGVEATNENILNKKVLGWQATLFEADRSRIDYGESPITLTNVEGTQVWFDPQTSSFRQPNYVIMKEPVSYEEAVAKYPDIAEQLKGKFQPGTLNGRGSHSGSVRGRLFNLNYSRDMCVVRTIWYRYWPYPMTPDEAVSCGKVQIGQVPDESAIQQASGANVGDLPNDTAGTGEPSASGDRPEPSNDGGLVDGEDTSGPIPPPVASMSTRPAFLHSETGEEVNPAHPAWPTVNAVREVRDIEGEKVFDRRSQLPDIPVRNNVNIAVMFSPYGIGEPDRLDGLQMALNRVLSDIVAFNRYNAYPPEVRHEMVSNALGGELRKARTQPNSVINVNEPTAALFGHDLKKISTFLDIPQMGADSWKLLEFLVTAIDQEANNSEVQQGIAPSGTSGEWVKNLQAAAQQVAQVTSLATEAWARGLINLFVDFIANSMTPEDIGKYCKKYPPAIIQAFHDRQKALYLDITVQLESGSAASKQGQMATMVQARQTGITVSEPSILERMNLDPDAELKREAEYAQKKQAAGLAMPEAAQSAPNNKQKAQAQ